MITAGESPLTVMPVWAYSFATPFTSPMIPAFVELYQTKFGLPSLPAIDAISKILP